MRAMERRIIEIERKLGDGGTPTPTEAMAAADRLGMSALGSISDAIAESTGERWPQTSEAIAFSRVYNQADLERDGEIMRRWCQHLGVRYENPDALALLMKEADDIAKKRGQC